MFVSLRKLRREAAMSVNVRKDVNVFERRRRGVSKRKHLSVKEMMSNVEIRRRSGSNVSKYYREGESESTEAV